MIEVLRTDIRVQTSTHLYSLCCFPPFILLRKRQKRFPSNRKGGQWEWELNYPGPVFHSIHYCYQSQSARKTVSFIYRQVSSKGIGFGTKLEVTSVMGSSSIIINRFVSQGESHYAVFLD